MTFRDKCRSLASPEWLSLHLMVALVAGAGVGAAVAAAKGGNFTPREIMLWSYPGELMVRWSLTATVTLTVLV